jgi:hypothetical protein
LLDPFRRLDALLVQLATAVAHVVQRWTGRTSFFLAKCGLAVFGLKSLLELFNHFFPQPSLPGVGVGGVLTVLMVLTQIIMLDRADDALRQGATALPDWVLMARQGSSWWLRLLLVAATVLLIPKMVDEWTKSFALIRVLDDCGAGGMTAFHYFVQVDPLPPGVSKVRAFFSSLVPSAKALASSRAMYF